MEKTKPDTIGPEIAMEIDWQKGTEQIIVIAETMKKICDPDLFQSNMQTLLVYACHYGSYDHVKTVLEHGALINSDDVYFFITRGYGQDSFMRGLPNETGIRVERFRSNEERIALIRLLVKHGADLCLLPQ